MTDTQHEMHPEVITTGAGQSGTTSSAYAHAGQAPYAGLGHDPFAASTPPPWTSPLSPAPATRGPREPRRTALRGMTAVAILLAGGFAGGVAGDRVAHHATSAASTTTGKVAPGEALPAGSDSASGSTAAGGTSSSLPAGTAEAAAKVIGPSVVTVEVTGASGATDGNGGAGGLSGLGGSGQAVSDTGSGIVLRSDGYIITNNHVVEAATSGGTVHVTFSDGKTVAAHIVGTDPTSDIAVIKVDGVSGPRAATFADSERLTVGQAVLAVGAPLGLSNTVTEGIVSTLHRPVATGEAGASAQSVIDAVQTDAAINPGNSGGALVNLAGQVVGINSAIASTSNSSSGQSGNIGVGFAIPSSDARKVAEQLIKTGHAVHAQIGISAGDAQSSTTGAPGLGATVGQVTSGGPAAEAGLHQGDVVTAVSSSAHTRRVTDANSLIVAVRSYDPGATVTLTYLRGGAARTATVTLGSSTAS